MNGTDAIYQDVKVIVNGNEYTYFMCNQLETINKKLAGLGYRRLSPTDYRYNPSLSENVRQKMIELGCCYSMTLSHGAEVVNYFTGKGTPYTIFLRELKSDKERQTEKFEKAVEQISRIVSKFGKQNKTEPTPLMVCVYTGDSELAEKILESGADVNQKIGMGFTALHLACLTGKKDMAELLLKHGANVNLTNDGGFSPLIFALYQNHNDIANMLLDHGATPGIPLSNKVHDEKMTFNQLLNLYISDFTMQGRAKTSQIYKNTNEILSKQTFSKIRNETGENYHPTKKNVFLLCIGMHLTLKQSETLLSSAGYAFDSSSKFDTVVKRFIDERNFNIDDIEAALYKATKETFGKYER